MPCWFFSRSELENTVSFRSGVNAAAEEKYRREGAKLIIDAGTALGLRYDVCATSAVYFHRFYMFHSFTDFHRYVVASSCLFLAAKMDDSNVTCDAVISAVQALLTQTQFSIFGKDPKQEVLVTEKVLVEGLRFDLIVELPYPHLLRFIKLLQGDSKIIEQLLKMSWTFINDSLCTTLCIEWEPDLVAISLLYLSCRLMKFKVTSWVDKPDGYSGKWYTFFVRDVNLGIIENICHQILDLYAGRAPRDDKERSTSQPRKASPPRSPPRQSPPRKSSVPRRASSSMSMSPPSRKSTERGERGSRSRSVSPRRKRSRSPTSHRDDPVYKSPLGSGEMLTRKEFERLQHKLRMKSGLGAPDHATFTAPPHYPFSIPVHQPPPLMNPVPAAPPIQHLPPPPGTVMFTHQPTMPAPLHGQQMAPFPHPVMEPPRLAPAPPHEIYHDPQIVVRPHLPVAQPLPLPPGVHLHHVPAARPPVVIPPGNLQHAALVPNPAGNPRVPAPLPTAPVNPQPVRQMPRSNLVQIQPK